MINLDPIDDGVTHINVYSRGSTTLGRQLSNFYHAPINHPKYGWFNTIEGLWYWLKTGKMHESFRSMTGHQAKAMGREYPSVNCKTFKADICAGITEKLIAHPQIYEALRDCRLPLVHYYYYGQPGNNPKVYNADTPENAWVLEHIRNLQRRIQMGEVLIPYRDL